MIHKKRKNKEKLIVQKLAFSLGIWRLSPAFFDKKI
jgi:hypothetical protein